MENMAPELPLQGESPIYLEAEIFKLRNAYKIPVSLPVEKGQDGLFYVVTQHGKEKLDAWVERMSVYEDTPEEGKIKRVGYDY
jgi:hypothetical protein